jgi:GNAT superfamily N-acetyltransferase
VYFWIKKKYKFKYEKLQISSFDRHQESTVYLDEINGRQLKVVYIPTVVEVDLFLTKDYKETEKCKRNFRFHFILYIGEEKIGYAQGNYQEDTKSIVKTYWEKMADLDCIEIEVDELKALGYGTMLLETFIKTLKSIGCIKLISKMKSYDEKLVRFYSRLDFDIEHRNLTKYL